MPDRINRWEGPGGYREFLVLAFPLIISTGAWSIQHFVDRMFLSWYSPETMAASLPAGMFNFALTSLFIGTASYVSTFVAQYQGAGRRPRIGPSMWQGLYVSFFGALIVACFYPLAPCIFGVFGHEPQTRLFEVQYFQVLCLGTFPAIGNAAVSGFFSGIGKPWPVMWMNSLGTAINLLLDYALIFGHWGFPEMGIAGAALASVIGTAVSFLVLFVMAVAGYDKEYHTWRGWRPEKELFARLLRFGLPSGVQFFLDMAGFTAFILLLGRLGTTSLAATTITFNINNLAFLPMVGGGIAISVLVGQYLGADRPDLAERSAWSGFRLTLGYMTIVAACYVLIPEVFVAPFAAKSDTASFAEIYGLSVVLLRFVAIYSIFDAMNIVFASAIKGAGDTRFVMVMLLVVSLTALVVPTWVALVVFESDVMTAWIILTIYISILGLTFLARFLTGKWKSMRVIEAAPVTIPGLD